jgi:CRISPR/Cas system CMR-associated protein Cmr5 small subunit
MESLIDDLLPKGRKVLKDRKIAETKIAPKDPRVWKGDSILEIYENYTSAFPIMIDKMGLRTAVAIYNVSDSNKGEGNKKFILQLLFEILKSESLTIAAHNEWLKMVDAIIDDNNNGINVIHYEEILSDAAIALKRAIRTFPLTKK